MVRGSGKPCSPSSTTSWISPKSSRQTAIELSPFDLRLAIEEVDEMLAPRPWSASSTWCCIRRGHPTPLHRRRRQKSARCSPISSAMPSSSPPRLRADSRSSARARTPNRRACASPSRITVRDFPGQARSALRKFSQVTLPPPAKYGGTRPGFGHFQTTVHADGRHDRWWTSRPGEGSTFWFTCRLTLASQAHAGPSSVPT